EIEAYEKVVSIGSIPDKVSAAAQGLNNSLILRNSVQNEGILYAFSAYFVELNPVIFQIWRSAKPINNKTAYTLIHELEYTPTVTGLEDIPIHTLPGQKCMVLELNDKLGIFLKDGKPSIGYTFDDTLNNMQMVPLKRGKDKFELGKDIAVDKLYYPYTLSVVGYIDTDMSEYPLFEKFPECPKTLGVPGRHLSQIIVYRSGPKGEKGDRGEVGFPGPRGERGIPGPSVGLSYGKSTNCVWCAELLNPYLILGLMIWMVILSLLVTIVIATISCKKDKTRGYVAENPTNYKPKWKSSGTEGWQNPGYDYEKEGTIQAEATYSALDEGRTSF
ncbi:hypothetical protein A3Q56_04626, partial [Intoshia linei]